MSQIWLKRQENYYSTRGFGDESANLEDRTKHFMKYIGSPPKFVLVCGCSDGSFVEYLAGLGFQSVGVDLPSVIQKTRLRLDGFYPNCAFEALNLDTVEDLKPEWTEKFDVVCAAEIIEHLIYDFPFLVKMNRYVKPGGIIILTTPNIERTWIYPHLRIYPLKSLRRLFKLAEFKVIKSSSYKGTNLMVGRKNVKSAMDHGGCRKTAA